MNLDGLTGMRLPKDVRKQKDGEEHPKSGKKATPVEMYARRMYSQCEDAELRAALP